jgi:hypothetical protein
MIGIPSHLAFLCGGLLGVVSYGPVKRWMVTLRRELAHPTERPGAERKDSTPLLLIFATMHPAPWLVAGGVPFALYQLTLGPLPLMWLRLIVGIMMGIALMRVYETKLAGRLRP